MSSSRATSSHVDDEVDEADEDDVGDNGHSISKEDCQVITSVQRFDMTLRDKAIDGTLSTLARWQQLVKVGEEAAGGWDFNHCDAVQKKRWKRELDDLINEIKVIVEEIDQWRTPFLMKECGGDVNHPAFQELLQELNDKGVETLLMEADQISVQWQSKYAVATETEWNVEAASNLTGEITFRENRRANTPPRLISTTKSEVLARLSVVPEEFKKQGEGKGSRPMLFHSSEEDESVDDGEGFHSTRGSAPVDAKKAHVDFVKGAIKGMSGSHFRDNNNVSDTALSEMESSGAHSVRPEANKVGTNPTRLQCEVEGAPQQRPEAVASDARKIGPSDNNFHSDIHSSRSQGEADGAHSVRLEAVSFDARNMGSNGSLFSVQSDRPMIDMEGAPQQRPEVDIDGAQPERTVENPDKGEQDRKDLTGARSARPNDLFRTGSQLADTLVLPPRKFEFISDVPKGGMGKSSGALLERPEERQYLSRSTAYLGLQDAQRMHETRGELSEPYRDSDRDQAYQAGRRLSERGGDRGRSNIVRSNVNGVTPVHHSTPISSNYYTAPIENRANRSVPTPISVVQNRMPPVTRLLDGAVDGARGHNVGNHDRIAFQANHMNSGTGHNASYVPNVLSYGQTGRNTPYMSVNNGMDANQAATNGQAISAQELLLILQTTMREQNVAQCQLLEAAMRGSRVDRDVSYRRATLEDLVGTLEPEQNLRYLDGKSLPPGIARNRDGLHLFERFNSPELREACASSARYRSKRPISDNELRSFNGDPIEFRTFIIAFRDVIIRDCDSDVMKLELLKRKCTGPARAFLDQYESTEAGFERAVLSLFEKYDRQDNVIRAIHNKFAELRPVREDLATLDVTMSTVRKLISELDRRGQASGVRLIDDILLKFPPSIQDEARRSIGDYEMSTVAPAALVEEINRISIRRLDNKLTRESRYESAAAVSNCPSCKVRGEHRMIKCPKLKYNSYTVQLCWREQRCLRCFESDHTSAYCPDGACTYCGERHHDQLCEAVREANQTPRRPRADQSLDRQRSRDATPTDRRNGAASADQRYGAVRNRSSTPYGSRNHSPYGARDRSQTPYGARSSSYNRANEGEKSASTPRVSFNETPKVNDHASKPMANRDLTLAPKGERKDYRPSVRSDRSASREKPRYNVAKVAMMGNEGSNGAEYERCSSAETGSNQTNLSGNIDAMAYQESIARDNAIEASKKWLFRESSGRF